MLSNKQMNTKIASIRKSYKAAKNNVQEVLCSGAGHALQHKDVSSFTRLIDATEGADQKRIMAWIRANGLATWNKDKECYQLNKSAHAETVNEYEDGTAYAIHLFQNCDAWYVAAKKPSQIDKELDALKRIQSLRSQIAKKGVVKVDFQSLQDEMQGLMDDIRAAC